MVGLGHLQVVEVANYDQQHLLSCINHFVKLANVISSSDHDRFIKSVSNSYIAVNRFNLLWQGPCVVRFTMNGRIETMF